MIDLIRLESTRTFRLLHGFDLTYAPRFVEERLLRAIETQNRLVARKHVIAREEP
jgi:hypothetical protein